MSSSPSSSPYGPHGMIKHVLKCDDETAETVRRNLGGVMQHEPTRAFIGIAWHLNNTTVPVKGRERDQLINEGKRMAALFLVNCAGQGLNLKTFQGPEEGQTNPGSDR